MSPKRDGSPSLGASLALLLQVALASCAPRMIHLQPEAEWMLSPATSQPLGIVVSLAGGSDPMPVRSSRVVYGGLGSTTSRAIAAVVTPWVERHRSERSGGWQMLVEIVRSEADMQSGRLTIEIETRVTMRGALGPIHLGQTLGYCKVSDVVGDTDGSRLVFRCLDRMARDLAGWLEGLHS